MNTHQVAHIKISKPNFLLGLLLLFSVNLFLGQNKLLKLEKEFSFSQVPLFKLNASHTKIIFTTWNKKTIGISAYVKGDIDKDYLKEINRLWEIQIEPSDSILILSTDASKQIPQKVISTYNTGVSNVNQINSLLKTILDPMLVDLNAVSIPVVLQERLPQLKFDFEAYNSLGETYFKVWEHNLVKDLDEASTKEVLNWSKQVGAKLTTVSQNVSNNLPNTINDNKVTYSFYKRHTIIPNIAVKRVIELKVPKETLSFFNTRYGSVHLINEVKNLKAKLKYTSLEAESIGGKKTNIEVAFAPVKIQFWKEGNLQLNYVKSGQIKTVKNIVLNSNSSKVVLYYLEGSGMFKSTFSQLGIDSISIGFSQISFLSTNSDLVLNLPDQAYGFVYSGEMSGITLPKNKLELKQLGDYRNLMLHGYSQSRNTEREIQMNVVNSQIILK